MENPIRTLLIGIAIISAVVMSVMENRNTQRAYESIFEPDWEAISSWPQGETLDQIAPDAERITTVVVLDDSGSMAGDINAAKDAVIRSIELLPDSARVAVIGLNAGDILEAMPAPDAKSAISVELQPVPADGSTPLAEAVIRAFQILETEATRQRGFGTYRVVITTDGEADDNYALQQAVAHVLSKSPIEVTTIGIGMGRDHVLKLAGHTNYIPINNIKQLEAALIEVNAEQTIFEQLPEFQ